MIGTKLAHYEITGHLGTGGMGEVFQATDSKLGRSVAIKFIPEAFSHDHDRVARFEREARVLASLNHPNIAAIHGLEEIAGRKFLVMELVEGDTLAERIKRGPLPVVEALGVAESICEALEAAHDKGVVHRDLKPANIKITPDGKVKVLDFGLAKALEGTAASSSLSNSPTLSIHGTQAGMILGTAAYMSPEQAKGFNTDPRSDVFSFGCVFYEMLTGRTVFDGDSISEILASVLKSEADLSLLPKDLNPRIETLLRRALEKNPRRRWYAIGDVRVEIGEIRANPTAAPAADVAAVTRSKFSWTRALPVMLGTLILGVIAGMSFGYFRPSLPLTVTRFPVPLGEGQQFAATSRTVIALSPDGTQLVYESNRMLYHRLLSEMEARAIPGTENSNGTVNPVFSPDGRSVAFYSGNDRALKKIAVTGGAAVTICPADIPFGMSWDEDGIIFGQGGKGILRVSANGGQPETLVRIQVGEFAQGPQMLPGGKAVLFTLGTGTQVQETWDRAQIVVQVLKSGERKTLINGGSDARYVSTGHIVYAFSGTLFAIPFDLGALKVHGGQVPVVEGVRRASVSGAAHYSVSGSGSLVYLPGPVSASNSVSGLALMVRKGAIDPLKVPPKPYNSPRVSPDGKRLAVGVDAGIKDANIWIQDLAGDTAMRQLTLGGANRYPIWSADGEWIAFQSDREGDLGIFRQRADGTGIAERLTKPEQGIAHIPDSWYMDGQRLSYSALKGTEGGVRILSIQDKKDTVFAQAPSAFIARSAFSHDGKWLAYQSNETGPNQIFVQPFPATGAKYKVVNGGQPFWSLDGKELFYNPGPGRWSVISITTKPEFSFSDPSPLPVGLRNSGPTQSPRQADITPDGRLIGLFDPDGSQTGTSIARQINVVVNWFEDLKQRMSGH